MQFELFDPEGEVRVSAGNLPHWYQPGVTYFITFRTEDSLPREVADLWYRRRDEWLRHHGLNPSEPNWQAGLGKLREDQRRDFHKTFSREFFGLSRPGIWRLCSQAPRVGPIRR
jgi:hypothetical protein